MQSELSSREVSIQSNFTGIEILLYGSIDFSQAPARTSGTYDVIMVIRSPDEPLVARRKERVARNLDQRAWQGLCVGAGLLCGAVDAPLPGDRLGRDPENARRSVSPISILAGPHVAIPTEETFRSAVIRLKEKQDLFQELDDGVDFVGRSLFRGNRGDLPVNVPIGRYTTDVYLFRDGEVVSRIRARLEVTQGRFRGFVLQARLHLSLPLRAACGRARGAHRACRLGLFPPRIAPSSSAARDRAKVFSGRQQAAEHRIDVGRPIIQASSRGRKNSGPKASSRTFSPPA